MRLLLLNLLLAIVWAAASAGAGAPDLVVGFAVGYVVLWWLQPLPTEGAYFRKLPLAIRFAGFFLGELVLANLRVAWDVVTPRVYRRPGIIAIPLDARSDLEIAMLSSLVTLTPGTVSLDVSNDRRVLYVHAMFIDDPEQTRRSIKDGLERRVLELLR